MSAFRPNPSGLSDEHRVEARNLAIAAARLGLARASSLTYTQGPGRREGINRNLKAYRGQCPKGADCSAFVTWSIWNGLDHYGIRDTVNGARWKYGYTGTMVKHGVEVPAGHLIRADAILYGDPFRPPTGHTALYVGGGMGLTASAASPAPGCSPSTTGRSCRGVASSRPSAPPQAEQHQSPRQPRAAGASSFPGLLAGPRRRRSP